MLTILDWNFECWAVQKYANLIDLVKSFPTSIYLQNLASMQPRTSDPKLLIPSYYQPTWVRSTALWTALAERLRENGAAAARAASAPGLKGSIGEGPNQTNYSDRSSVKILSKFFALSWVRFDRRGIEPFELFRSEFGQRRVRSQRFLLEFIRNKKSGKFKHYINIFYNSWRNSDKNSSKAEQNSMKFQMTNFCKFAEKYEKVWRNFAKIFLSERCKSMYIL